MAEHLRFIWQLLVLSSLILLAGILSITLAGPWITVRDYMFTVLIFTIVNLAAFLIMVRGITRGGRDGVVYLMGGLGLKFLLYLLYILGFWLVTKNLTKPFILTFFTLYLAFTFFLAGHLLKYLKNK